MDYYQPLHNIAPAFAPPTIAAPLSTPGAFAMQSPTSYDPLYIPAAGPSPYNSLVLVKTVTSETIGSGPPAEGQSVDLTTNFVFPGFDFRTADQIQFRHSSVVCVDEYQGTESLTFNFDYVQVNKGFFSDTGNWTLNINFSASASGGGTYYAGQRWRISSWILCNLPPATK